MTIRTETREKNNNVLYFASSMSYWVYVLVNLIIDSNIIHQFKYLRTHKIITILIFYFLICSNLYFVPENQC